MINITKIAEKQVLKKLKERNKGIGIKIGLKTSGCNGLVYTLEYADDKPIDCEIFESEHISIIVEKKHLIYFDGILIDFEKNGLSEGFTYKNPNEKSSCGCGESFNV